MWHDNFYVVGTTSPLLGQFALLPCVSLAGPAGQVLASDLGHSFSQTLHTTQFRALFTWRSLGFITRMLCEYLETCVNRYRIACSWPFANS